MPSATARALLLFFLIVPGGMGCCAPRPAAVKPNAIAVPGLTTPRNDDDVHALVTPPVGWVADPLKSSSQHRHRVWLSPTRETAFGVIYIDLPWPVGADLALWGFLRQMQRTEGQAILLGKQKDTSLPGIRFEAEGGLYHLRTNLIVEGFHCWAIYAGTLRAKPVRADELKLAEAAREHTRIEP